MPHDRSFLAAHLVEQREDLVRRQLQRRLSVLHLGSLEPLSYQHSLLSILLKTSKGIDIRAVYAALKQCLARSISAAQVSYVA